MEQKNSAQPIILTAIITAIITGGIVYFVLQNQSIPEIPNNLTNKTTGAITVDEGNTDEPLNYSIDEMFVSVSKETAMFDYTANQLASMAEECGNKQEQEYFDSLVSKFSDTTKTIYKFKYTQTSQESDTFIVTLLPNKTNYSSLNYFKKDFDQCYAGGNAYPTLLNNNWLLFINSCGTGFDDESGKLNGCQKVRDMVEPTLKLK
ncbi:MAG TPA: hypothetical protein PLV72_00900 [Candidatus Magasanikbacteria bacterium]|nr:hypothetical protein [Candidatus Magasanikbacteria bacterium]